MAGGMDERVVSMEFDNKQFEKNVKTSMKTIDDLKESLDFEGVGESLDTVDKKFKLFGKHNKTFEDVDGTVTSLRKNLALLGEGGRSLLSQFAEVTKITALFEMAEQAVNRLQNAIKQFTIAPIAAGFQKYGTKIGSIKTIANATGMAAEQVDASLDRLNWFTDETSASFESMVQNIGKFTSVGKGLDESITAMQGIAAWGYHSGASVAEQTRAMYNLSQALGTGSVKLIDWKSIENAGMATKEFKEQAIAAAEAAGTLTRKGDKLFAGKEEVTVENFNSTLAKGWFSSDVLMDTLKEYGTFADKVRKYQEEHPQYSLAADAMEAMDLERAENAAKQLGAFAGKTVDEVNGKLSELDGYDEINKYVESLKTNIFTEFGKKSKKSTAEIEKQIKAISTLTEKEENLKQQITAIDNSENKDDKKQKKARADLVTKQKKALAEREKAIKSFAKEMDISAEEAVKLIDALGNSEESLGEKAFKSSQQAKTFEEAIDATKDAVSTGWMKTFQYIFGGLDKSIELWSDVTDILWDLFAAGADFRNNAFMHWAEEFNGWADLWNADESKGPLGALRNIMNTVIELKSVLSSSFKDAFFPELAKITGLINNSDEAQKAIKFGLRTSDQRKQWREGNYMGYQLKQMTSGIREFTAKINEFFTNKDNIAKIRDIFTAIATAVRFAVSAVTGFFSAIGDFAKRSGIFQDILNILSKVSTKITEVFNKLQASGFIQKVFGGITDTFVWFYDTIKGWITQIKEFFDETGITQAIKDWFDGILEFFTGSEKDVDENGKRTESGFFRAFGWIENVKAWFDKINLKDILYDIKMVADNFGTIWNTFTQALGGTQVTKDQLKQGGVSDKLAGMLESVSNFGTKIAGIWGSVKGVFESVTGWLESSGILPAIRNAWDAIKTFFGNLGLVWEVFTTGKVGDPKALDEKQKGLVNGILNFIKKLKGAWDKVKGWFTAAWAWIGEKWNLLVGWLESSGILPTIRNVWEKIKMFFSNIGLAWEALVGGFNNGAVSKDQFTKMGMSDGLAGLLEWFSNLGASIRNIINKISGAWDTAKNWLETSGILPTLRSWWAGLTEWFEGVKKDLESNGVFKTVGDFFTNMWSWITGLFGGGEEDVTTSTGKKLPKIDPSQLIASSGMSDANGKKNGGFFSGIIDTFRETWTKDGKLDISQGFSKSIAGVFEWIGSIDWAGISTNVFGIMVGVVNGLNDALGKLQYQNIVRVIKDIVGIFSGIMWARTVGTIFSTIRSIVKKGNDKSLLEQFTDLLSALGQALLQIGIAVALVAASMWVISKIDPNRFDAAVNVMIGIGAFFLGFMIIAGILTAAISKEKDLAGTFSAIGGMFVQIGVAVALIVASIWVLTQMLGENGEISDKMRNAMIIIGGIMLLMVGLIAAIGLLTKHVGTINVAISIATFTGMAILLAAITVCLMLLQGVDFEKSQKNALLLGGVLLAMAGAMKIMNNVTIEGKTVGAMIAMAVVLGIVTAAFVLLKDTNPETIKMTAIALGGVLLALAVSMLIISKIPAAGVIKGAAGITAALAILAVGIAAAAVILSIGAQSVLNNFVSVMSSMATASISAGLVDENKIRSVLGLLGEVAVALGGVGLVDSTKAIAVASAAWDVFNQLKLASVSASLVNEKNFYKIFGQDGNGGLLQIIQTGLSSVTDTGWKAASLGTHVEQLSESLKLVGQAGLMLDKELDDYGKQTYTQGIQAVKERLTDIQTIVEMATTMGTTGEGENMKQIDLTTFAEGISNIGAALQLYNKALETFQTGGANNADTIGSTDVAPLDTANISTALQSVMSALRGVTFDEGEVGAIESWAGLTQSGDSGTLFALGLTNIANAMGTFSTAAKDFDNDNVKNAVESLGTLADIQAKVTNPNQYKTTIDGITAWGDSGSPDHSGSFANAISSMGTAMAAFGQSVKDIPSGSVTNATTALDTLAKIYEKLKGKEDMVSSITETTKNWFGESTKTITYADQSSSSTVFKDFSTGIGYLGDALAAFGAALSSEEYKYDENKVKTATSILEQMVTMQESLVKMEPGQGFFDKAFFGENGFKKLGDNISGLGARLATFANELGGGGDADKAFDIDIDSDRWKNISGVLTYLVGLATELNNLSSYTEQLNEEGQVISSNMTSGFTLENLANGINKIRETMINFNQSMREWHTEGGGSSAQYQLGQWSSDNWNNIKTVLNDVKQLAIDMKSQNLSDADINLIGTFGEKISQMFDKLNTGRNAFGAADNVSQISEFVKKLSPEAGFNSDSFSSFITNLKGLAEAAGMLHGAEVDWTDVNNLGILAERIMSITTTGFNAEAFTSSGLSLATQFITGFINGLATGTVGEGEAAQSVGGAIEAILDAVSFFEKGKTAGAQYAAGFKEGAGDMSSFLSPVVSMDASGKTATSGTPSLAAVLTSMNYVTTDTISTSIANIEAIKTKLNETIKVDDGHSGVLSDINLKLRDLDTIKSDIGKLEGDINRLKVYISPDLLVGAIADKMDRVLGNAARVSP